MSQKGENKKDRIIIKGKEEKNGKKFISKLSQPLFFSLPFSVLFGFRESLLLGILSSLLFTIIDDPKMGSRLTHSVLERTEVFSCLKLLDL